MNNSPYRERAKAHPQSCQTIVLTATCGTALEHGIHCILVCNGGLMDSAFAFAEEKKRDLHKKEPPVQRKRGACSSLCCPVGLLHGEVVSV